MTSPTSPFSAADIAQLEAHGISTGEAVRQLRVLENPPAPLVLDHPCTHGDGILSPDPSLRTAWHAAGNQAIDSARVRKFVPASGAATRMFKDLIGALKSTARPSTQPAARTFLDHIDDFAFGPELRRRAGISGTPATEAEERHLLDVLLHEMRYAELPKGLIPFHNGSSPRTAFEEQLVEGMRYTCSADGRCEMHFTVAPEFRAEFSNAYAGIRSRTMNLDLRVTFSEQHAATDTLALTTSGEPARNSDGTLLLRPGGHGSLLRNLQEFGGDIVVIKNIDNVLPPEEIDEVVYWKTLLTGCLATIQSRVFGLLRDCERGGDDAVDRALAFAADTFNRRPPDTLTTPAGRRAFAFDALDRPLRVCGVVRNEGEPGGAPFWVRDENGSLSIQIVESAQVDGSDAAQSEIFRSSTHFNPVDIVCGLRSWNGEAFDLTRFVDEGAVFIAKKSHNGSELFALERPGLWNGGMAKWNTVCVEVPAATFAPVKTILDLLRPQHRAR